MGLLAFRYLRSFCRHRLRKSALVLGLVIGPALLVLQYGFLHDKGMLNNTVTLSPEFRALNYSWFRERRRAMDDEVSSDVKCVLPDLNPFNVEVMRHYQKMPPVDCSGAMRDWVYTANGKFHISSAAREQYGPDITCKYIPIVRVSDYDVKDGSPINPMVDGANLTSDFFKVECASSSGKRYNNIHLAVARNKDIFHRLESYRQGRKPSANRTVDARETRSDSTGPQHTSKPLNMNVFIVGLDSMSRMSYMRNLPQVRHYFVNKMGAIELEGYNIVGDGTPAALLPILTGHTEIELPEARRGHEGAQPVDGHPWLYKDYVRHGYVTVHGEDSPGSGTFQYRMLGFKEQPTDHYMRTFYLAATPLFKDHLPLCLGSNPRHVSFMNWYRELFSMYRDYPKIFFGFHAELSHGHFNAPQAMDGDLLALLKDLERDGHLNKTLLILMADHGARFNHIRAIPQGKLEERNPYFALRFPPWFLEKYPGVAKNLKINSRRLTTPFDIYATLSDLLNFTTAGEETSADRSSSKVAVSRGMSLLREIPKERRCSEAGVTPHWCACLDWKHVNQSEDKFVAAAVQASLEKINSITQEKRDMCAVLELREITRSLRYVPTASDIAAEGKMEDFKGSEPMKAGLLKDKFLPPLLGSKRKLYQVSFITAPGQGHFEVTCTLDVNTGKIQINTNDISRMNQYGSAPSCLKDAHPQMNPFCYCK